MGQQKYCDWNGSGWLHRFQVLVTEPSELGHSNGVDDVTPYLDALHTRNWTRPDRGIIAIPLAQQLAEALKFHS